MISTADGTRPAGPAAQAGPAGLALRDAVRRCLTDLEPGALVLVACSGGPDSLALAAATAFVAPRAGLQAGAVVVDHGLQAGSDAVAAGAAQTARALGLDPVEVVAVSVDAQSGDGPEAAARTARYAALDAAAERLGAVAVLLGHTRDDQAESVLLGLLRGSGARSLAGMPVVRDRYRRPLLSIDRDTTRLACAEAGLEPWLDPQNSDPAYARVRARDLLTELTERLGPGVPGALARSADLLRADADALDAWAALAAARADPQGEGALDVAVLEEAPAAVRTRVLHRAALAAGSRAADLAAAHVRAMDALVTGWHGQGPVALPGGVRVERACGRLRFTGSAPARTAGERTIAQHPAPPEE